ncbi:N-acetyl-alpha-D-glucosaminyl L-malate synthase [Methylococcales bacterium]|nr:N-acetyl-alpha-D-glucosaminyl L-malate synthase [Methylococcales bacterium]
MDKKVNILFIAHDNDLSGACLSLLTLLSELNKDIFSPHVIVPWHGDLKNEIENLGIPVYVKAINHWIPFKSEWGAMNFKELILNLKSRIWAISHIIEKNKIDVVYTNTVTVLDGALAAYATKKPHIWHAREFIKKNNDIKAYLPSFLITFIMNMLSDHIIVNSNSLYESIKTFFLSKKISIIHNAVNIKSFNDKASSIELKKQLNIPFNTRLVSYVGALTPRKDIVTFINAANYITSKTENIVFLLVGQSEEPYITELNSLIDELSLRNNLFILGQRNDIPALMHATDVLVLTSIQEAFGRVIIEAMAASKPVVATKSGGPEEIIVDGETGFLVPVKDAQAIANKVTYLLEHPDQAQAMGENGCTRAQKMFSMNQYIQNIEKVIIETVSQTHLNSH